jgi:hypothetical protein
MNTDHHPTPRRSLMPSRVPVVRAALAAACGLAAVLLFGCQDNDGIRSYPVTHEEKPKVRLLGVIAPRGERTWFFKFTGPAEKVEEHREAFERFVQSAHFTGDADKPLQWTVPDGWRQGPKREERYATFLVGPQEEPLEVTVTALGKEAAAVLPNVNRWRGQIGLAPLREAELDEVTRDVQLDGTPATFVDMTGRRMAGTPMGPPPMARRPEGDAPAGRTGLKYTTPEGWKEQPPDPRSPIPSVATFRVGDVDRAVTVTPLASDAGGMLPNVLRWRTQVKLGRASEEQARKDVQPLDVPAGHGYYADLTGPESEGRDRQRLLAAAVEHAGQTWFFKMLGPAEVVGKQKANFEAFVRSVRFDEAGGANP